MTQYITCAQKMWKMSECEKTEHANWENVILLSFSVTGI